MTLGNGWPPFYSERPSAAFGDPSQFYLGYGVVTILIGLLLVLPGVKGRERMFFFLRWSASLFVGASIIACVQGKSWHEANVKADMPYKVSSEEMVNFRVGLMIGLTNFNVTLRGNSGVNSSGKLLFSEKFYFLQADEGMNSGLQRGLPFPILNVVEHFSVNRISSIWMWGRRYWVAGHYSFYLLWSAIVAWFTANILFHTVLRYGGLLFAFTGFLLIGANFSFLSVSAHGCKLQIHIGYYDDVVVQPTYGWCFWLCLSTGCFCVITGAMIFMADHLCSKALRRFFNRKDKANQLADIVSGTFDGDSDKHRYEQPSVSRHKGRSNEGFQDIPEESSHIQTDSLKASEEIGEVDENFNKRRSRSSLVSNVDPDLESGKRVDTASNERKVQVSFNMNILQDGITSQASSPPAV